MAGIQSHAHRAGSTFRWWFVIIAIGGVGSFLAVRLVDARPAVHTNASMEKSDAVGVHCAQFMALARAQFGTDWRVRLDPSDPLCAEQIQREWEKE